mmetsp:Transcript_128952/g.223720  ORF Transcript_128952/g.223720 Transcript_128952/m.223720 type:complete len:667 (+) Transcript_128952:51-2051(+)
MGGVVARQRKRGASAPVESFSGSSSASESTSCTPVQNISGNVVYVKEAVSAGDDNEVIERDTEDTEDVPNLSELLLPPHLGARSPDGNPTLPVRVDKFSVSYSMQALMGWVKQPSPCCAAASVAGAWNAIFALNRKDPLALDHKEVLTIYRGMISKQVTSKVASFERQLGAQIEPLLKELSERLEARGTPLGGKGAHAPKRADQLNLVREIAKEAVREARAGVGMATVLPGELPDAPSAAEAAEDAAAEAGSRPSSSADAAVAPEFRALPVYELICDLLKKEQAEPAAADKINEYVHDEAEEAVEDGRCLEAGNEAEAEEPQGEQLDMPPVTAAEVGCGAKAAGLAHDEELKVCDVDASDSVDCNVKPAEVEKPGLVLEFDFSRKTGGRKKKAKGPPKAVVRRLQEVPLETDVCQAVRTWDWKGDMLEILRLKGGLAKLSHATKPNTGPIGNWGICSAVDHLQEKRRATHCTGEGSLSTTDTEAELIQAKTDLTDPEGRRWCDPALMLSADTAGVLTAKAIMGRGKTRKGEYAGLSPCDSPATRAEAWAALRTSFMAPRTVLLFHLKNHYALIFAIREWEEEVALASHSDEPEKKKDDAERPVSESPADAPARRSPERRMVRQILTARRGQRPSVWLDFEEAVETMLAWDGYKIIRIQLSNSADAK